jgi:hypothetical protein
MKNIVRLLTFAVLINSALIIKAQNNSKNPIFSEIKILLPNGEKSKETSVIVTFYDDSLYIVSKDKSLEKNFKYSEIQGAEYSYSKNPRWKTGLGLGAASFLFPPLLLVAIPVGFTKHRRHWVTIKTDKDFAVLKLSKSSRKLFIPTFETKSGVTIEAIGEDK